MAAGLPGETRSFAWTLPAIISPGTRVTLVARDTSLNQATDVSTGTFFVTQANADQVRTMVVWNESRMRARHGDAAVDLLEPKLHQLVGHAKVDGVLLDLSSGEANAAGIGALYAAWDATPWSDSIPDDNAANVTAANATAAAIRSFLYDRVATLYPNLETMILVGGDLLVPFFREADTTPLHPETSYPIELESMGYPVDCDATRSPTFAAVCSNSYLSDGRYGASAAKPVPGSPLSWWLPDVAVGRLVETPAQISGLIETYVAQDGVTLADQLLTSGYDFLTDGGDECRARLLEELDPSAHFLLQLSEAVGAWTDQDLRNRLFGVLGPLASKLSFVSGHADHRAEGAASPGASGILTTLEMDSGTGPVPGAMVVGLGCHSGLSVAPDGGPSDPVDPGFVLDLPELFATKRFPVFIGNSGFGWGLTDGVGLGERLLVNVADEITRAGQVSLGEALRLAKQEYFLRQDDLDSFDHKVIHESTLYGIPNYEVRVTRRGPAAARGATEGEARIAGETWLGDPAWREKDEGGRRLAKSEAEVVGDAPAGVSLRVMDFSYQAFATDPPAWQAGHAYDRMTVVRPAAANGHVYAATTAGTSGGTPPSWPTGAGATVADGTVTWTEYSSAWPNAYVRHDVCRNTSSGESEPCANADGTPGAGQTKVGVYLTLDGMSTGEAGNAIQPMISFDSHLSGTKLHGIMIRGGEYEEPRELNPVACLDEFGMTIRCFDPVVGNPQTKGAYPEGPAPAPFVMLSRPTPFVMLSRPTPLGFDESNGNTNSDPLRRDNLNAPMGEMVRRGRTPDQQHEIHTEWLYRTREFSQFYSGSSDWTAPVFGGYTGECSGAEPGNDCYSVLSGLTATIVVPVTDAGEGVYRVYVTYSSDVDSSGRGAWRTTELSDGGGGVWTGTLELRRTTHYLVQAVDWAGNVATVDVTGNDVAGNGSPMGSSFTLPRLWTIEVPDSDGDGLPDAWEAMHPCVAGGTDPDDDLLSNLSEFDLGLDPCNGDSDGGGDNDGSEQDHGRTPFGASDDLEITIGVSKAGATWTVDWGDGRGLNAQIDGKYHVYRNATPFFGPGHRVAGPLSDATKNWSEASPSCDPVCYYRVWNVALALPPPTVTVVSPGSGPAAGNTPVNVFGSDFVEGASVFFRGVAATSVVVHNGSWISCRTPTNATGACDVKVVNPSGQEGVVVGGFSYTP